MKRRKIAVATLSLVAIGLGVFVELRPRLLSGTTKEQRRQVSFDRGRFVDGAPAPSPIPTRVSDQVSQSEVGLRIRAVNEEGIGINEVTVALASDRSLSQSEAGAPKVTNELGIAEWPMVRAPCWCLLEKSGYCPKLLTPDDDDWKSGPGAGETVNELSVLMRPASSFRVFVTDPNGNPVPEAAILLFRRGGREMSFVASGEAPKLAAAVCSKGTTGEDGSATIGSLASSDVYLDVRRAGYLAFSGRMTDADIASGERRVILRPIIVGGISSDTYLRGFVSRVSVADECVDEVGVTVSPGELGELQQKLERRLGINKVIWIFLVQKAKLDRQFHTKATVFVFPGAGSVDLDVPFRSIDVFSTMDLCSCRSQALRLPEPGTLRVSCAGVGEGTDSDASTWVVEHSDNPAYHWLPEDADSVIGTSLREWQFLLPAGSYRIVQNRRLEGIQWAPVDVTVRRGEPTLVRLERDKRIKEVLTHVRVMDQNGVPLKFFNAELLTPNGLLIVNSESSGKALDELLLRQGLCNITCTAPGYSRVSERGILINESHSEINVTMSKRSKATVEGD